MSGPTVGIGRIVIPYTVSGLTHVCRMYVSNPTLSGGNWVIDLNPDYGGTSAWTNFADGLAAAMSSCLATGVTPGTAILEELLGTGFVPRDTHAVTFPNLSGNTNFASEITLTLRDRNFTRPKIVLMECNQVAPAKYTSPTGGAGGLDAFIDPFLGSTVVAAAPYQAMVNHHEFFLLNSSFVSVTLTYNRKLRRARGLA